MSSNRTTGDRWLIAAMTFIGSAVNATAQPESLLQGAAWRDLVLHELIPPWQAHVIDWDDRYGGWYDRLTVDGEVLDSTKTVAYQLYTNVGLALYSFATGDPRARQHVEASLMTDADLGWVYGFQVPLDALTVNAADRLTAPGNSVD